LSSLAEEKRPLGCTKLGLAGWLFVAERKRAANDLPLQSRRVGGCVWERWDAVLCACLLAAFGQVTLLRLVAQSGEDSHILLLASSLQVGAYFGPFY